MDYSKEIEDQLTRLHRTANIELEQHFCVDPTVIKTVITEAKLTKKDVVLEIGAGTGILTRELVKHVQNVIAVEADSALEPILRPLSGQVELIFDNALNVLKTRQDFTKIVANIPYQISEPLLKYLCLAKHVQRSVLTVSRSFALKAQQHPVLSAFLDIEIVLDVSQDAFFPPPNVLSAVIVVTPSMKNTDEVFIRRKLYLQRDKKLKNGLVEALIDLSIFKHHLPITKKKAKELIDRLELDVTMLDTLIDRIHPEDYRIIALNVEKLQI